MPKVNEVLKPQPKYDDVFWVGYPSLASGSRIVIIDNKTKITYNYISLEDAVRIEINKVDERNLIIYFHECEPHEERLKECKLSEQKKLKENLSMWDKLEDDI